MSTEQTAAIIAEPATVDYTEISHRAADEIYLALSHGLFRSPGQIAAVREVIASAIRLAQAPAPDQATQSLEGET
jgi:hypothetical protein